MAEKMKRVNDVEGMRDLLWREIPQSRKEIVALENRIAESTADGEEPFIGIYRFISEVFWWGVLEPALRRDERPVIDQCLRVLEVLLVNSDDLIQEAVLIRVVGHLKKFPEVRNYASANLIDILDQE